MRTSRAVLVSCLIGLSLPAGAETTTVDVYVLSRDAKFVGTSMGGARVTIADAVTGEVLAQGVTEGGTGDTERIMSERKRGESLITDDAARFSTALELASPRQVRITAYGPLDFPHAANTASATQWVLPGKSPGDQGWIVELPGLIVDVNDAPTFVKLENGEARLDVRAEVRLMCGCPFTPDGLWDSNELEIVARVLLDDHEITSVPLSYAGQPSTFDGTLLLTRPGSYQLAVQAHQQRAGNAGIFEQPLVVD